MKKIVMLWLLLGTAILAPTAPPTQPQRDLYVETKKYLRGFQLPSR